MKTRLSKLIILGGIVLITQWGWMHGDVQAKPSYARTTGNSCGISGCHSATTGRMSVANNDTVTDLGLRLDGQSVGSLKTFSINAGETATLSVTVLNGSSRYAVQIKGFESTGLANSLSNQLTWSNANGATNPWTLQQLTNPPYYTKHSGSNSGITWGGSPMTYSFDLLVDASTPADFYDLAFAVAGTSGGLWVQEEHFYLQVLNDPGLVGDLNGDGFVGLDDLDIVLQNWNQSVPPGNALADPSGDGFVGLDDLDLVLNNWNAGTPPADGAAVPEPTTGMLLGLLGAALVVRPRKRPVKR